MSEERWDEHQTAARRPHRPLPMPSAALERIADEVRDPASRRERAYATAAALLQAGVDNADDPDLITELVRLDETVGLDGLRELWGELEQDGLPAALWSLYLLRAWLVRQGPEAARLYTAGRIHAPVADAVAGVPDTPTAADLTGLADAIMTTALLGDPPGAMDRAAAIHRVLACGRFAIVDISPGEHDDPRHSPPSDAHQRLGAGTDAGPDRSGPTGLSGPSEASGPSGPAEATRPATEARLAEGNLRAAARLECAAAAWRAGDLAG